MENNAKPSWQSKTAWFNLALAILPFIPGIGDQVKGWISANPEQAMAAIGAIGLGLRKLTNGELRWF